MNDGSIGHNFEDVGGVFTDFPTRRLLDQSTKAAEREQLGQALCIRIQPEAHYHWTEDCSTRVQVGQFEHLMCVAFLAPIAGKKLSRITAAIMKVR